MKKKLHLYTRFERLWHWVQAALIFMLAVTGFEIHGTFILFGFEKAHNIHIFSAWSLLILTVFAIFWHLTTGEWKQYIPSFLNIVPVARYYLQGIVRGERHPFAKTRQKKLNPLQKLAYFTLKAFLLPLSLLSGLLYLFPDQANAFLHVSLGSIAVTHTAGAFALVSFFIVHTYLTTTGGTLLSYIKAMITGWEETEH